MEYITIYFKHGIKDVIPYTDFIMGVKDQIHDKGIGEYLGDDMAIDGGDAEAVFACRSATDLFEYIKDGLADLSFMRGAKVTFTFGELDSGATEKEFYI